MSDLMQPPKLGIKAPAFSLPATDGKTYGYKDIAGDKGAVIVFICNHCPYVKAITDRLVDTANELKAMGVGFAAICSNDAQSHPADSFENMAIFAQERGFTFPYLWDESQEVARAYDAVCTPDFYGMDAQGVIQYRGRLDEGRTDPLPEGAKRELFDAMVAIAQGEPGPETQHNSVGCSIKWKS